MARVLVSCFSPILDQGKPQLGYLYEGFVKSLLSEGNDVLVINSSVFLPVPWAGSNQIYPTLDAEKLIAEVIGFDPELVFAFNHSIPAPIIDNLECPIVVWDADSIQFYNDIDIVRKNASRYYFFCFSKYGVENAIKFGVPKERAFFVPPATTIEAKNIGINQNISFIGTMFQNDALNNFIENYDDKDERNQIVALVKQGYSAIHDPYILARKEKIEKYVDLSHLFSMYSPTKRIEVLNSVADLGLGLYGGQNWLTLARFFPDIALSYRPDRVYSLKHNEDVYNSSKLCLNVSHSQVIDGYAWRVLDILASNGCLLTDSSPGISTLLKNYIDMPMYKTASEARELAERLLKDENMRLEIVRASQKCIEDKGRWKHRFAEMEAILHLKLLAAKGNERGSLSVLDPKTCEISAREMIANLSMLKNRRTIIRYLVYRFALTRWLISNRFVRALIKSLRPASLDSPRS